MDSRGKTGATNAPSQSLAVSVAPVGSDDGGERCAFELEGIEYAFRWCPPGEFIMGSPEYESGRHADEAQVSVKLTTGFWMQETVVTQSMWSSLFNWTNWGWEAFGVKEGENYPIVFVGYSDAMKFCERLTAAARQAGVLPASAKFTLPTEARWEYACRAWSSENAVYSFGDEVEWLSNYAWFDGNAGLKHDDWGLHEVGKKSANDWGLLDMHGNVWEWCQVFNEDKPPAERDLLVSVGTYGVLRGGSWYCEPHDLRCASRDGYVPSYSHDTKGCYTVGFRMVIDL